MSAGKIQILVILGAGLLAGYLSIHSGSSTADFSYTVNAPLSNSITITYYTGASGKVSIPATLKGLPVTCLGRDAFYGRTNLVSVTIPASVSNIGFEAFADCDSLRCFIVDAANQSFSSVDGALFDKTQTRLINYPRGRKGSYSIPGHVTSIERGAFNSGTNLTGVTIPSSVTNIELGAFTLCANLKAINVDAANNCFCSMDGVLLNKAKTSLIQYPEGKFGACAIPDGVISIEPEAFVYCPAAECTNLTSVTIPASVTNIEWAFWTCPNLTNITVDASNPIFSSRDGVLFDKNQTKLIRYPKGKAGSYAIPATVTNFNGAFSECANLTGITIPRSISSIGESAFYFCTSLTNVIIPASVRSIGSGAFHVCPNLPGITVDENSAYFSSKDGFLFNKFPTKTTRIRQPGGKYKKHTVPIRGPSIAWCSPCTNVTHVTLPGYVTQIDDYAFNDCYSLTRIIIPASVIRIEGGAFRYCTNLTEVCFEGNAPDADPNIFYGTDRVIVYYLPGTTGWAEKFGDRPTALWHRQLQNQ